MADYYIQDKTEELNGKVHSLRIFLGIFGMIAIGVWTIQWILY